jgi:phage terminase small subunit
MLTTRQGKFVEHYAFGGNTAEAARLAGYSARSARVIGPETLSNPAVKEALAARQRAFQQELGVAKQDVVNGLLSAIQMGREQQNPAVMIQGCVQLARLLGFYEPEHVSLTLNANSERLMAKYAAMSDDELLAIAAGKRSA